MSDSLKIQLISAGNTFLATFLTVLGTSLSIAGTVELSAAFWGGLLLAGVRAGIKAVIDSYVPKTLGGRKA